MKEDWSEGRIEDIRIAGLPADRGAMYLGQDLGKLTLRCRRCARVLVSVRGIVTVDQAAARLTLRCDCGVKTRVFERTQERGLRFDGVTVRGVSP